VVNIDRRLIGLGKPGPVTRRLAKAFHLFASSTGTPIV
jgi:hypothetical protein